MFIKIFFTTANKSKSKCPLFDEWINKMYLYNIMQSQIWTRIMTCIKLENILGKRKKNGHILRIPLKLLFLNR